MVKVSSLAAILTLALLGAGCGGNMQTGGELTQNELLVRERAAGLAAPEEERRSWANPLRFNLLNFDVPWSSRDSESSNSYINEMFRRRFGSQEARYTAMVDDSLRAELELEAFVIAAREVAREDEQRLAAMIELMASGAADTDAITSSMDRVRNNRAAVEEGLAEARSWEQTFTEVRDRAEMELPGSAQAAQLRRSVGAMGRWSDELLTIADRMSTSTERVASQFMDAGSR